MSNQHEHGGNVFAVARSLGIAPEKIIDFSASINPLGMAPAVADALVRSLDRLLHYPDKHQTELKESLAAYHAVTPGEIAVANGSTELIHLLPRVVKGKKGLVVAPAFAEYALALKRCGWEVDYFTLKSSDGFRLSLPALQEKINGGYDILFVCNPANPTGSLLSGDEIAGVIDLCRESGTFLVLDEAFIDFCEYQSAKHLILEFSRGVLLRSMTKFFAIPGLRLGYAIAAPEVISAISSLQDPWTVNTAAQVAGVASLSDRVYCERSRVYVGVERQRLASGLEELKQFRVFPSAANYLLVETVNGAGAAELRGRLMEKGILIRDCSNFVGLDGRYFRVAVRLREENEMLLEELGKICRGEL